MITALQLIDIMKETGKPLSELAGEMTKFPQVLRNIEVVDKNQILVDQRVQEIIEKVDSEMGEDGRILVRPSATESLARVIVEAPTIERGNEAAEDIV